MDLHTSTVRRLAFIKYLYRLGIQQSEVPEPFSSVAVLIFHDTAELFLQLASENLDAGDRQLNFMDYWQALSQSKKRPIEVSQKESMRRLNKARVALKHHGTLPSKLDIEAFRATITSFFEENTPEIFGVSFGSISMTDFVQPGGARENLKDAERLLEGQDFAEALNRTALAFQQMLEDYEARKRDRFYRSPFFFGRDLTFDRSSVIGIGRSRPLRNDRQEHTYERRLAQFVDNVRETLEAMQEAMKILAMGIDYRRYSKFRFLTPTIVKTYDGHYHIVSDSREQEVSADDVGFCIDFVVETAVKLNEFDYSLSAGRP